MRIEELPMWMAICLLLTVALETAGAAALGVREKKGLWNVVLINVITNPFVVVSVFLVGLFYGSRASMIFEYAIEAAVVIAEGLFYRKVLPKAKVPPMLLSLILNAMTYGAGLVINLLIPS